MAIKIERERERVDTVFWDVEMDDAEFRDDSRDAHVVCSVTCLVVDNLYLVAFVHVYLVVVETGCHPAGMFRGHVFVCVTE